MSETIPFYPWSEGDHLYASALNAAIRNSVSLGGNNKDFRTAYDFGAKGSVGGVLVDDTAALNTAFAQTSAQGGGRVYIPDSFYAAGPLTVPPGVEIYGNFATHSEQYAPSGSFFLVPGSKLILGSGGLALGRSCILRNIMVLAASAPTSNPTNLTQSQAAITAMTTAGTGINIVGDNCLIDTIQLLGFNYGIRCVGNPAFNRQMLRNIHGDCINGIHFETGGDTCRIEGAHFWPYLTAMDPTGTGTGYAGFQRNGVGIYTKASAANLPVLQCTVFGWQTCFQCDADSVTWVQCWADGNAPNSAGFATTGACGICQMTDCVSVANQFAVHHSPSNGAVLNIKGCSLGPGGPGGSTPTTGASIGIYADGHGPVQAIGNYFNGGNFGIWLGPNTHSVSGSNTLIGNIYDDVNGNWGYIYSVDPAVIQLLVKFGNQVINSSRSYSDFYPANQATGQPLYDNMPNYINGASFTNTLKLFAVGGNPNAPELSWTAASGVPDQNVWDIYPSANTLTFRILNDTASTANSWLNVSRTGMTLGTITLTASGINLNGAVGFQGTSPIPKPTIGGAKGGNTALGSLISALVAYGLVVDSTTA